MRGQTTSSRARGGRIVAAHPAAHAPANPGVPETRFLQSKYRTLIRRHLGRLLDKLFAEFTGLHFHISWAPAPPREWATQALPAGCSVCSRLCGSPLPPECRVCGPRQLAQALGPNGAGHRFTCRRGVRNYWIPIRVRGATLGLAYLQALDHAPAGRPGRKRSTRTARRRADAIVMSRLKFLRATRLLRLIVQHVQTSSLADLRKADLTNAGRAVLALENEQARLHEALERHLPASPQIVRCSGPESHPEQIVRELMTCVEQNYARPLTLRQCAARLGMNAAYLSALFSRVAGVPFKSHLTALRMEKARGLLSDPARTVSEIAYAVGYASENRFRNIFKKQTGLAPKLWRETLRAQMSVLVLGLLEAAEFGQYLATTGLS